MFQILNVRRGMVKLWGNDYLTRKGTSLFKSEWQGKACTNIYLALSKNTLKNRIFMSRAAFFGFSSISFKISAEHFNE